MALAAILVQARNNAFLMGWRYRLAHNRINKIILITIQIYNTGHCAAHGRGIKLADWQACRPPGPVKNCGCNSEFQ
jgi:hypothetical protein